MNAYESLEAHFEKIADLGHIAAIMNWDESAMMPTGVVTICSATLRELVWYARKRTARSP